MTEEKILFDTDIGSDIDDAVCLAYLLSQPRCRLMGITTVSGEPFERAKLASAICRVAGRDVPIYPGTESPLLTPPRQPKSPQSAKLANWPHDTDFPQNQAVEFLARTIRENPGEITLLAVGPMTNVALLFATHPDVPGLLKQLVLMCGVFTNALPHVGPLEWNAICDPYATAIVYNAPVKRHVSIGLDVTCQVVMGRDEVRERFQTKLLRPVLDFADVWFQHTDQITFHDPLAGVVLFEDVCGFRRGDVEVELASPRLLGLCHFEEKDDGRHEVALQVDREAFFRHYFETVSNA